jgi:Ras GTPase-activating-like protein IQGAP2/3
MDLKIDDLLEKVRNFVFPLPLSQARVMQQKDNKHLLDLEYVQLNVPKVLGLLNKVFAKRKT